MYISFILGDVMMEKSVKLFYCLCNIEAEYLKYLINCNPYKKTKKPLTTRNIYIIIYIYILLLSKEKQSPFLSTFTTSFEQSSCPLHCVKFHHKWTNRNAPK